MPTFLSVDDLSDDRVAAFRDVRDRDLRGRDGTFVAESPKVVRRLLGSTFETVALLLTPDRRDELADALETLPTATPVHVAREAVLSAVSGYHVHGGALALARRPHWREITAQRLVERLASANDDALPRRLTLLGLAGVTHMDNVGSIFRSAAGLGCDGIILDDRCCDPLLRKALRVAIGHSLTLPWARTRSFGEDLATLRRAHGFTIVGAESGQHGTVASRVRPLRELPDSDRMAILFGNEGHGLDHAVMDLCDVLLEIPMQASVPSLNVAVAAAVVLYERGRGG